MAEHLADRPSDPSPRTVWLASYPKSGNTWIRAILAGLRDHANIFNPDRLGGGGQPYQVGGLPREFGIDPRWLSREEMGIARHALLVAQDRNFVEALERAAPMPVRGERPRRRRLREIDVLARKTHECYRSGPDGAEAFPTEASRGALLIVRDPRDVACSYAPFFGVSIDEAIDRMADPRGQDSASPARSATAQPWGSWSSHVLSWLDQDVPFPVITVRYEDLQQDAVAAAGTAFRALGMVFEDEDLRSAVERTSFERMAQSEAEAGFRERSRHQDRFFRRGMAGGWADELTDEQVARLEADHGEVMRRLGYELVSDPESRKGLAQSRESRRRHLASRWNDIPEHLELDVRFGPVDPDLPDAARPRPWIQVSEREVRVEFAGGTTLRVADGREAVIQLPEADLPSDARYPDQAGMRGALVADSEQGGEVDLSWMVQGWAITLATLQRGDLSLHAATVRIGDRVVAVAGARGAGKSTTAMGLRNRGHQLLVDDVTLVHFDADGVPVALPFDRNVHLLPDAVDALGLDLETLPLLFGGRKKVAFRPETVDQVPQKIDQIVVLQRSGGVEQPILREVRGVQRVPVLHRHTSRDGIAPLVLGKQRYMALVARLADAVPVRTVTRPKEGWTLPEVLDLIEESAVTE